MQFNIGVPSLITSALLASLSSDAYSQNGRVPEITLSASNTTTLATKNKRTKVGSELAAIEGRFRRGEDGNSIVTIEAIATSSGAQLLRELERLGLQGGSVFGKMVSGKLSLQAISTAESLSALGFIRLSKAFTRVGSVDSQADVAMDSISARATYNVDGSGIMIGILSDSYDQLGGEAADIASGDLPNNVNVLDDTATGSNIDEGRAMAQLIHDVAPGADLLFHTAFNGAPDFAQGILDLANAGSDVIVDDIGYLNEPMFQDGVVAQAVDQVVANGVSYFSSAGNSANNSYEAPYNDSGTSSVGGLKNMHSFTPGSSTDHVQEIVVPSGDSVLLSVQWDQPFASAGGPGATTDLDVGLVDSSGNVIAASTDANIGADAVELLFWQNTTGGTQTVGLVIGLWDTPANGPVPGRIKWIDFRGSKTTTPQADASTVFGHPNSNGAIAVGASAYFDTPAFGVSPPQIEPFSSYGGLTVLFDGAGNAISEDRSKPEITAPDGTDNTFFGSDFEPNGFPNFFGTSAAAPHAAAVAALQLECDPSLAPATIEFQQSSTAIDMESSGFDNISGDGLIQAPDILSLACVTTTTTCFGLPVDVDLNLGQSPTNGDDVILGTPGNDTINGLGGNDYICGGDGFDTIFGSAGDDYIKGGNDDGTDTAANDLFGGSGDDNIYGGPYDDYLYGQGGADFLETNNTLSGLADIMVGGSGNDTLSSNSSAGSDMRGNGNNDTLFGSAVGDILRGDPGLDTIYGYGGDDEINGGRGADILYGGIGSDQIYGADSRDDLFGEAGDDFLYGGLGNDDLDGGTGNDFCNGQGQTGGTGDTAVNCETSVGIPRIAPVSLVFGAGRIVLTDSQIRRIDNCNNSLQQCLRR